MPLMTQYQTFFISPFGEPSVCDELNRFLSSHRIVNVEKRLVDGERGTGWLFLVEYGGETKGAQTAASSPRIDYREVLSEQEYALFDKLRQLRKDLAEKQGLPVYAVFTNEQLAGMVKAPARSLKDLAKLPGVGESRVKQYGEQFVTLIVSLTGNEAPQ
jgi:superfamily II DNA helicase RecQ